MSAPATSDGGQWAALRSELRQRTLTPFRHVTFVLFLIGAVVGLGGFGVWVELYSYVLPENPFKAMDATALRTALLTFFPALAGTAAFQLVVAEKHNYFRAFAVVVLLFFFACAAGLSPPRISNERALELSTLLSVIALWVWIVANARDHTLADKVNPDDSTGGSVSNVPMGNLNDLQV